MLVDCVTNISAQVAHNISFFFCERDCEVEASAVDDEDVAIDDDGDDD